MATKASKAAMTNSKKKRITIDVVSDTI